MAINYSENLQRFKALIENGAKNYRGKEKKAEIKNLLYWFVDNCPSKKGPEKSKKFSGYGICKNSDYKKLKHRIIDKVKLKKEVSYKYCKNHSEMKKLISEIERIYSSKCKPTIYFSKGEFEEMDSLYIRIRNSFAHGNYFKKGNYYILWNESGSNNKKNLSSFMTLKYEHLKAIYDALSDY